MGKALKLLIKWLKSLTKKNLHITSEKIYVDRDNDITFFYYRNGISSLRWLNKNKHKINTEVNFVLGLENGVHGLIAIIGDDRYLIPSDRYLVIGKGRLEAIEKRIMELIYDLPPTL